MSVRSLTRKVADLPAEIAAGGMVAVLDWEDGAEDVGVLPVACRLTCRIHHRWLHECVASPAHVSGVAGHRWCRRHGCATSVVVDELLREVTMACPLCGATHLTEENRAILGACRRSIRMARSPLVVTRAAA